MPHLYTSSRLQQGSNGETQGFVYEHTDAGAWLTKITSEPAYDRRTSIIKYRRNTYLVGTYARGLVRDRYGSYHNIGIRAPQTKPTLTDGAFSSGSTGNMIGYVTFVMKVNGLKICESNPGPQSDTLEASGTGRLWDSLDWHPADPHVTHARGYVSVDGALPALAWERGIAASGTGQVTENVGTAALGETLPVRKGINNQFVLDLYARGVPPYTKWSEEYHDAIFYAGDPIHPERIYYSKLFEPEAVNSTPTTVYGRVDEPWLTTTDGLPVTGIKRVGDELIVGTYRGIDRIQGYGYGDYAIHRISNYFNVIAHWSMKQAGPNDSLFFASSHGPTIYNSGNFRFIGEPIATWWRDQLRLTPTLFEDAYGVEDRFWETYNLLIPQQDNSTLWLVVDFNSAEAGTPIWVMDRRARKDWVSGELAVDSSTNYWERYTGSCDGLVRQENDFTDGDDDGDSYQKKMTVETGHRYMNDQSGDEGHGRTFHPIDLFLQHQNQAATLSVYCGEDDSPNAANPAESKSLPARALPAGKRQRTKRTSERVPLAQSSGKGITVHVEVVAPIDVEWRGWAVQFREGPGGEEPFV